MSSLHGNSLIHRPDQLFHVAVMPCFDKKLEASRSDFYDDVSHSKDVDCVLTTGMLYINLFRP